MKTKTIAELAAYDLGEATEILGRLRTAIGDGHAIDADEHALGVTLKVLEHRRPVQHRFSRSVKQAAACVTVADSDGILVAVSDAFAELLGYEPGELLGRSALRLTADDERSRKRYARLVRRGRAEAQTVLLHKDGHRIGYRYRAREVVVDGRRLFFGIGEPLPAAAHVGQAATLAGLLL